MKKCTYCGKEYPDDATVCPTDGAPVTATGMIPPPAPPLPNDLTTADWLVCILCSGIGCIFGIVRLIQGKPNGAKMLGMSILFAFIWVVLRVIIVLATVHN
jgi:hypothetical protein